eukprot:gene4180-103_t
MLRCLAVAAAVAAALAEAGIVGKGAAPWPPVPPGPYPMDVAGGLGPRFDGVGGLSGGGATSELLVSYPEPQRSEVLDYLFKPGAGAALHMLKVEIGGDAQSTDGSESSHMHDAGDLSCARGYEFWLMKEAKARNPSILVYGLPWAFPGWLKPSPTNPNVLENANTTAEYIARCPAAPLVCGTGASWAMPGPPPTAAVPPPRPRPTWVRCRAQTHGVHVDLVSVWNEQDHFFDSVGPQYMKTLRRALDARGFAATAILGGDVHSWSVCGMLQGDQQLASAVAVVGKHYPGTSTDSKCHGLGKPMWSSEDNAMPNRVGQKGGACQARILVQNYVNGNITATINWNLVSSYYPSLPWADAGLFTAREPWSGHYELQPPVYATAHTTMFAQPGWHYLAHGHGSGWLAQGGSYATYVDASTAQGGAVSNFSLVIEKQPLDRSGCMWSSVPFSYDVHPENATFRLAPSLPRPLFLA